MVVARGMGLGVRPAVAVRVANEGHANLQRRAPVRHQQRGAEGDAAAVQAAPMVMPPSLRMSATLTLPRGAVKNLFCMGFLR
jgi:hypothetical protein